MSPVKNMARTATRDVVVRDQQLHEGDQLILFYPSANRDESVFEDAQRLDVRRDPNPHLAFGFGPHFCMGAALARLELRVMFGELLRRLPDLELSTAEPVRVPRVELRQRPRVDARPLHPHHAGGPMTGPLDGVTVVELGVWVAGPGAGGLLADWGADVVKIEPPEGDPSRLFARMFGGDLDVNPVFELDNRGKRSIVLDLSTDRGPRDRARAGERSADVFVTNIRAAALERLGLGPDTLRARFDRLVYAIITGYGLDGPDADRAAYDIAAFWARSGMAEALRTPGGPLPFQRAGMGDHTVAMTGAAMICAALYERERTGKGQLVSTSLLRQGAYTIGFDVNIALMWGRTIQAGVRETIGNPTVNNYTAADGLHLWLVGLEGDRHWPALARAVGRPEWLDDPRYATGRDRAKNARELIAELDALFATKTRDEWADRVRRPSPTCSGHRSTRSTTCSATSSSTRRELSSTSPTRTAAAAMLASPADFDGQAPTPRWRAPRLGEHTTEVLLELGRSQDAIDELVKAGVAGPGSAPEGR